MGGSRAEEFDCAIVVPSLKSQDAESVGGLSVLRVAFQNLRVKAGSPIQFSLLMSGKRSGKKVPCTGIVGSSFRHLLG